MKKILAIATLTALALPRLAAADAYPDKLIRIVVPYSAGGTTDAMARVLQEPLQKALGQTILVDNKPGASGVLAARDVIHSKPDGYTLFFVNNGNLAVVPHVVKDANYSGTKDFTPVALIAVAPMVAVVPASLPVNDLRGFIDYGKTHPVAYATAGVGSFGHLASALFANKAGLKMTHVPYKGQAPSTNAVLAGEVQLLITTPSGTMNDYIANNRLKLLGVGSSEPSPLEPGAPPINTVLPGYNAESWFAIVGPAGMPADVVAKLNSAFSRALQEPEVQKRFTSFGLIPKTASAQKLADMTAAEDERWAPVIRENRISSN